MGTDDFALARRRMVDGQLRPNRVTDPSLLAAMGDLPRERFVPAAHAARAYADEAVPLAPGRALASPLAVARLVQLLAPRTGEAALVAGAGSGYGAALLAVLGARVTAIEDDSGPRALATAALAEHPSVRLLPGDPTRGFADAAPFDAILIEGQVPELPPALIAQLAPGGRIVAVVAPAGGTGRATLGRRIADGFTAVAGFDLSMPPLPAFAAPAEFVF